MENFQFYNSLSPNYDEMINFENSLKNKMESLQNFISPNFKTALDLGCGSGADSIALAKLGLNVDAVDHSKGMLKQALQNSKKYGADINILHSGLGELELQNHKYDLIVSLGNTIANLDKKELDQLFDNIKNHVNPNSRIIFQLVNYANLPKTGSYILNEFDNENVSIIRKYNIFKSHIDFMILKEDKTTNEVSEIITKLYPYSLSDFKSFAIEENFELKVFGSLKKDPFIQEKSKNLVIVLSKKT